MVRRFKVQVTSTLSFHFNETRDYQVTEKIFFGLVKQRFGFIFYYFLIVNISNCGTDGGSEKETSYARLSYRLENGFMNTSLASRQRSEHENEEEDLNVGMVLTRIRPQESIYKPIKCEIAFQTRNRILLFAMEVK